MKSKSKEAFLIPIRTFFLYALSHGVLFVILPFISAGDIHQKQLYFAPTTFSEFRYQKPIGTIIHKPCKRKVIFKEENNESKLNTSQQKNFNSIIIEDSIKSKSDTTISESESIKTGNLNLNFSRSLLDSLLITNPGYNKLILKERIKNLKDTASIRQEWEKRLNDEIHKYLREYYPDGSENAINKYTGPGINIPIDDLIDEIKGIF